MIQRHSHSGLGGDGEKIDFNNLKNKPVDSSGGGAPVTLVFTKAAASGTGLEQHTGFGFQPSWVNIKSTRKTLGTSALSDATHQNGVTSGWFIAGTNNSDLQTSIVFVSTTAAVTTAIFSSFISDGIELNYTSDELEIDITITCFP